MKQSISDLTNEELILKCTQRSIDWEKYWREFENRYGQVILVFILREFKKLSGSKFDSDYYETIKDLRQDVYIKLLQDKARALRQFKGQYNASLFAYLNTISINIVINFVKLNTRNKRSPDLNSQYTKIELSQSEAESVTDITREQLEENFLKQNIVETLREYYPSRNIVRDIQIFKLFYFEELSAVEICNFHNTDLSVSGIETLISRMKNALKKYYDK